MNTIAQFHNFLAELQALIDKYSPDNPLKASKALRQKDAASQRVKFYRDQFALIVDYVANTLDLDPGLIDQTKARCRYEQIAWARQLCMVLCHELTAAGTLTIAQHFNCCDHGTVVYAKGRVEERSRKHPHELELLNRLRREVKQCMDLAREMKVFKRQAIKPPEPEFGPADHHSANPVLEFVTAFSKRRHNIPSPRGEGQGEGRGSNLKSEISNLKS